MNKWENMGCILEKGLSCLEEIREYARANFESCGVYPDSIHYSGESIFFIAGENGIKNLIVYNKGKFYGRFTGVETLCGSAAAKICELNNQNCNELRKIFPFTNPANHRGKPVTIGLGDRLGLASPGHIRLIKGMNVFPVLAQQSMRELNLTGRNYTDVLSAASWAVFQEGYTSGFGADGDHLKTKDEVKMAVDCGFTMITLDCSEHIDNSITALSSAEVDAKYSLLPIEDREHFEALYPGKTFDLGNNLSISFSTEEYKKIVLIYCKALKHTIDIFNNVIKAGGRDIDFEMSIDETLTPTTPESHYFVASELTAAGVEITSLAPRFCGEFQKGIDYRGDIKQFKQEFIVHVGIARHFGYKISVHSGSDKFSVFPIVGEATEGVYHLKTAGTNWLEAVRIIAAYNPGLYRRMHKFAVEHLAEARKYYHISAVPERVPDIDKLQDRELPDLMDIDDARQILHITYGLILQAEKADGTTMFKDELYNTLKINEDKYYIALKKHIGRHLKELGI